MSDPTQCLMTAEDFYDIDDDSHRYELVRGVLRVSEPTKPKHGRMVMRLTILVGTHVDEHGLGTVMACSGYTIKRRPDTVRAPDVSFVSNERVPSDSLPDTLEIGPDLAIEVLSPSNRRGEIEEKIGEYFAAGTRMVWVVNERRRCVVVRYPNRPTKIVVGDRLLEGEDVLPGFRCSLVELCGEAPGGR